MVERAERRFAARIDQKQEQQELTRLEEVEGFMHISHIAWVSLAWPLLLSFPGTITKDAIFRYRQKGNRVDGLLYHRGRARQYDILSLEEPIDTEAEPSEEKASLREVLSDPTQPRRSTEERAFANVLLDSLREHLSATENQALTLRLQGIPWREVGEILGRDQEKWRICGEASREPPR